MSSSSEISSVVNLARPMVPKGPSIEVKLDGHYKSKTYNSGSPVAGELVVTPWRDTRFDIVSIVFVGYVKTRLDTTQIAQHSSHTFLKLNMPLPDSVYPVPRIFEAGHTYIIPFNFVVPHHLTLSACNHKKQSDAVYDQHMRLPPSMGRWAKDDLSPDMTHVEYAIKARVVEQPELGVGGRPIKVMEAIQHINVLPASIEDPPLNITPEDKAYVLSKSKSIRKNLFSGKQGRLTATAVQPAAIHLSADGRMSSESRVNINLRFDPTSSESTPPKVSQISGKLQSSTWFSAVPMSNLPNMGDPRQTFAMIPQMKYSTTVPLFSADVDKTTWRAQSACIRRDSGYSSDGNQSPGDSDASNGHLLSGSSSKAPLFHQAALQVPFSIPAERKMFLPTFHSCLSSRTYTLQLSLAVGDTKINLSVPLQIVVEPSLEMMMDDTGLPSFDSVMALQEEADADELLRPRVMRQPAPEFQGTSGLPGYSEFSMMRQAVATV